MRVACHLMIGAALSVASPALAYRTGADRSELSSTPRVRWASGVFSYELHADGAPGLGVAAVREAVAEAGDAWITPPCSAVDVRFVASSSDAAAPEDGRNSIQWLGTGWSSRGFPADAAGATDVLYELNAENKWEIVEADIYLNGEFEWSLSPLEGKRDVRTVLTHEIGHALGLLHPCEPGGADGAPDCGAPSESKSATMYPLYSETQSTLDDDDVEGICFLYPTFDCEKAGCAEGQACTPQGCASRCGDEVCTTDKICIEGSCQKPSCGFACSCEKSEDCRSPYGCVDGTCRPGSSPPGDPCTTNADCASGSCSAGGFCETPCSGNDDCSRGTCGATKTGDFVCSSELKGFGEECRGSADCGGRECLQIDNAAPICTRTCTERGGCPSGFQCLAVDGDRVCSPPLVGTTSEEGCYFASRPSGVPSRALLLGLLGGAMIFLRRRRKRRS